MNILNAISTAITGQQKFDDSLLVAAKDKPEKEVIALVRKAVKGFSGGADGSRPGTEEATNRPSSTVTDPPVIDINLQNAKGYTILMYAAQRDFNDLARLLIDKGAKTSLQNGQKKTASALTKNEALKAFLQELENEELQQEKDTTINDSVERLRQAMLLANLTEIYDMVPRLPYPGECFKRRFFHEGDMVTLQDLMLRLGRDDVLETFVRAGGDVLIPDGRGRTALLRLVARRRLPSWPNTALARQQEAERIRFIHILLKSPACKPLNQLQMMDSDGFNALQLAVEGNLDNVVEALLGHPTVLSDKNKVLVNARVVSKYPHRGPAGERSKLGDTAFILAVRKKFHKIATLLVEQGQCEVDLSAQGGMTALHWAAFNGDEVLVRYLLGRKANINARTDAGHTPLMLAIEKRDLATATLLLGFMHTWDANGVIAGTADLTDMERFIREKQEKARKEARPDPSDPNIATNFGYTPLISLCRLARVPVAPALHTREGAASASVATLLLSTSAPLLVPSLSTVNGTSYPVPTPTATEPGAVSYSGVSTPVKVPPQISLRSPSKVKVSATTPISPQRIYPSTSAPGDAALPSLSLSPQRQSNNQMQGTGSGDCLDPVELFDLVKLLLDRGVDLNHKAGDGCTALMWAVYQNNKPLWHQLITAGADIDVLDGSMQPITERVRDIITKTEIIAAKHGKRIVRSGSPTKDDKDAPGGDDELRKFTETEKFEVESVLTAWKETENGSFKR